MFVALSLDYGKSWKQVPIIQREMHVGSESRWLELVASEDPGLSFARVTARVVLEDGSFWPELPLNGEVDISPRPDGNFHLIILERNHG